MTSNRQTNRQKNRAALVKGNARLEVRAERQARALQAERAWNWQWCDDKNRWNTKFKAPKAVASTRFTPTGPSKRTQARRAARHARGRR